jgi:hypothetical protein
MFRLKIYRVQGEILVAVCDSDIVGMTFRDEERGLKLEITEKFYGSEDVDSNKVREYLQKATVANISGRKAVKLAVEAGIVDKDRVLIIGGCPHAQMVLL